MGMISPEASYIMKCTGERGTFPMKARLGLIVLLAAAFGWLGSLTGAVPEIALADAPAETPAAAGIAAAETPVPEIPALEAESAPAVAGPEAVETEPEKAAEETAQPASTPKAELRAATIPSDGMNNFTSYSVDPDALRAEGCSLTLPAEGPQILILHSHSCEAYTMEPGAVYEPSGDWRTTDAQQSVIAVGEALKAALERYGLRVLHDTELYDWPSYNSAYVRSSEAIEAYLQTYPDLAMVIDLHRDAIGDEETIYKTVADTDGQPMAQLMFVVGTDQNLPHPNWRENLKLALTLQQAALSRCETLMRPIDLSSCRYNQQLTPGSLILEAGTCGNTLSEAVAAVECFAEAAGPVLAAMVEGDAA